MENLDFQPELPYPEENGENNASDKNEVDDKITKPEETVTDIQMALPHPSETQELTTNSPSDKEAVSIQTINPQEEVDKKAPDISIESENEKKLVDEEDRDIAFLIHNILNKRKGWETGLGYLLSSAQHLNKKLEVSDIKRIIAKYCEVDHKRSGRNYYVWNDNYVFNNPELEKAKKQQTRGDGEKEDWWNTGPIVSLADADFRHEMNEELKKDKEHEQENNE